MKTEYSGLWYSPKYPEIKLSGLLTIEEDNIELEIYSPVDFSGEPLHSEKDSIDKFRVLLGDCHGHKLTLIDSHVSWSRPISTCLSSFGVKPEVVFDGAHYKTTEEIAFDGLTCTYSYLSAWMEDLEKESDFKGIETQLVDFDERLYKSLSIQIDDGFTIQIEQFLREHDFTNRSKKSYQIHHVVNFRTEHSVKFEVFKKKVHNFRKLLELGLDTQVNVWFQRARNIEASEHVQIFHPQNAKVKPKESDSFWSHSRMLFSYYKLNEKDFTRIIQKWFETLPTYEVIYDFFLDTNKWFRGTGASLTHVMFNNRVLNVIQALESFHTMQYQSDDESKETFDAKLKEIVHSLDEHDQQWLRERCQPLRKGLRARLSETVDKYGFVLDKIVMTSKEKKCLINELMEIRNSLSHARHTKPDLGVEKENIYVQAKILLLTCILCNLGLTDDKVKKLITLASDYRYELSFCEHKKREQTKHNV